MGKRHQNYRLVKTHRSYTVEEVAGLTEEHPKVLVQDWYKDSQTRLAVKDEVSRVLDEHLPPEGYDKTIFEEKRDKVFELTLDLAINRLKWAA